MDLSLENKNLVKFKYVCGVDEVGRGPMAGPVVAACVALSVDSKISDYLLENVNDSKKVSEKKRNLIYQEITSNNCGIHFAVGLRNHTYIDKHNILSSSLEAMKEAVVKSGVDDNSIIFIDGNNIIKNLEATQKAIVRGDTKIFTIAAASIIAKVYRDKIMVEYAKHFPNYKLEKNKGYGTKEHLSAIKQFGLTKIHRRTFCKKFIHLN